MSRRSENHSIAKLTRRQAIAASSSLALGAGLYLAGCGRQREGAATSPRPATSSAASCVLTPEQTEGPYYIEDGMVRSDITEGRPGLPLELLLAVQKAGSCEPLAEATVEVWHCDALGVYSGFTAAGASGGAGGAGAGRPPPGAPPGSPPAGGQNPGYGARSAERVPADETTFLRGAQRADRRGMVRFSTVYPGWYAGRTPHIHVKVHVGGEEVHSGQLYFDDAVTAAVHRRAPYSSHGEPSTTNASDGIYAAGGQESTLALSRRGEGYTGRLTLGVKA